MSEKSILVKVDSELHRKIKALAKADKRSMGNYLALIIADMVKKELKRGNQTIKFKNI